MTALGPHRHDVVVIGGLNPELLTEHPAAPHLGTTDVDLLVEVGVVFDRDEIDLGWLEEGLLAAGYSPTSPSGWRWRLLTDTGPVILELLCDVSDSRGQAIALPGCATASAMNLEGPRPAMHDSYTAALHSADGRPAEPITARFAGLGGYLISKAGAVVGRRMDKDYYDFMFVLLYNPGGPRAASAAVAAALPTQPMVDHAGHVRAALSAFTTPDDEGTRSFVTQMLISGASDEAAVLAQDAVGAALAFSSSFIGSARR